MTDAEYSEKFAKVLENLGLGSFRADMHSIARNLDDAMLEYITGKNTGRWNKEWHRVCSDEILNRVVEKIIIG